MFGRLKLLHQQTAAAEADVSRHRRHVTVGCARTIHAAEQLADRIDPDRVALRRAGVVTELPTDTPWPVRQVLELAADLRRRAERLPIENGLLPTKARR